MSIRVHPWLKIRLRLFFLRTCASATTTVLAAAVAVAASSFFSACRASKHESAVERGNREQILHRGVYPDIADLDPHLSTVSSEHGVITALFEGLVAEDPIDLHPVPGVAERWDISPDGLTYTFHLRANARWSNGDSVTASDFAASFRRALTPELASTNATLFYAISGAEAFHRQTITDFAQVGVKASVSSATSGASAGPGQLTITLAHPNASFLSLLAHPVFFPVHLPSIEKVGSPTRRETPWTRPGRLVGNGPFTLTSWAATQRVILTRSATYWDAANVKLKELHFHVFESRDAEERAFRAGQIHLTETLPISKIDTYRRDQPDVLRLDPYLGTEFYRLNVRHPFFADRRVRRALALAIDRRALTEKILRGGQQPARAFTPPGTAGYTSTTAITDDFAAARDLLRDAGYPGGKGAPAIELLFNTSESHRAVAESVQEMWRRELGLQVQLTNQENTVLLSARRTGAFQMLRSVWIADYVDPFSFLEIWTSSSGNNYTGWSNPAFDAFLAEAARTQDTAARHVLLQKAETLLLDDAPLIPLYHYQHVFLIQPSVKNWHPTLLDHHPYKHVHLESSAR